MSENNGFAKKKNVFIEAVFIIVGLLVVPFVLNWFFYKIFEINGGIGDIKTQSKMFAYICTVVLDVIFIYTGALSDSIEVAKKRLGLVLPTIFIVDFKLTIKTWITSLIYDGCFVVIYLGIILYQFITLVILIKQYFA